eukprot:208003-Pleurochrysis_carterae.AAC.3
MASSHLRVQVKAAEIGDGVPVIDLFVSLEFAKSKSEVRRLISGGGAKLNDAKIERADTVVTRDTFSEGELKLSAGKKKHGIVELIE